MPQNLLDLVLQVKTELKGRHPSWSANRVEKTARALCVKSTGLTFKKGTQFTLPESFFSFLESHNIGYDESGAISSVNLEYLAPPPELGEIVEKENKAGELQKYRVARGTALYPVKSRNKRRYLKSEIAKASKSLKDVPFQKDHSESVKDTYGIIVKQEYNEKSGYQKYEALLDPEDEITKKIEQGFIKHTSVSISPDKMECSICGEDMGWWHTHTPGIVYDDKEAEAIPRDWYYRHLGTVTTPGVPKASVSLESEGEMDVESNLIESANEMILNMITEAYEPLFSVVQESDGFNQRNQRKKDKGVKMSEENEAQMKNLAKQFEKQSLLVEQLQDELKTSKEEQKVFMEGLNKQKHSELVEKVIGLQISLSKLKKEDIPKRKEELSNMNTVQLEMKFETLKEFEAEQPAEKPNKVKPRSMSFGDVPPSEAPQQEVDISERAKFEHDINMLGSLTFPGSWKPTNKALQTLERWDFKRNDWKDFKGVLGDKGYQFFK